MGGLIDLIRVSGIPFHSVVIVEKENQIIKQEKYKLGFTFRPSKLLGYRRFFTNVTFVIEAKSSFLYSFMIQN
jgi:hypothetical protein